MAANLILNNMIFRIFSHKDLPGKFMVSFCWRDYKDFSWFLIRMKIQ